MYYHQQSFIYRGLIYRGFIYRDWFLLNNSFTKIRRTGNIYRIGNYR